ncbi:MAG: hypothetical protein Q7R99_03375 [bacterium]|nr:hypothetical protein [bacterium]
MESLIKVDVFFFISSVATVVLTILASVLLVYLIKAGKILYKISKALEDGFKDSEEFIAELKTRLEDNIIFRIFFPPSRKSRKKSRK